MPAPGRHCSCVRETWMSPDTSQWFSFYFFLLPLFPPLPSPFLLLFFLFSKYILFVKLMKLLMKFSTQHTLCQIAIFTWITTSETWPKDSSTYLGSPLYSQANGITLLPGLTVEKYILQNFPRIISLFYPQNTFQATSIVRYCNRLIAWKVY